MPTPDFTIRGAGIWGLSIAWELTRRGARVQVIDPAPASGASAGLVGALSPHAPEGWTPAKQFQFDSLAAAPAFWGALEQATGLPTGYARTGRLMPLSATERPRAETRSASARDLWPGYAWQVIPAPPGLVSPSGLVAHDSLSARLDPRQTLAALTAALTAALGGTAAEGPDAGTVIHATGVPGLLATGLGRGVKGQAMRLAHAAPDAPQIYAGGLYIVPHADGTTAIGSTSETTWTDPTATDTQLDTLRQRAAAILPALATAPELTRWAALRPRADTRQPVLGPWPGRPGHILANGAFKIGFGLAPAVARVIADLAITGQAAIPDAFLPASALPKHPGG